MTLIHYALSIFSKYFHVTCRAAGGFEYAIVLKDFQTNIHTYITWVFHELCLAIIDKAIDFKIFVVSPHLIISAFNSPLLIVGLSVSTSKIVLFTGGFGLPIAHWPDRLVISRCPSLYSDVNYLVSLICLLRHPRDGLGWR